MDKYSNNWLNFQIVDHKRYNKNIFFFIKILLLI